MAANTVVIVWAQQLVQDISSLDMCDSGIGFVEGLEGGGTMTCDNSTDHNSFGRRINQHNLCALH